MGCMSVELEESTACSKQEGSHFLMFRDCLLQTQPREMIQIESSQGLSFSAYPENTRERRVEEHLLAPSRHERSLDLSPRCDAVSLDRPRLPDFF